jgi:hypothetical protein
MVEDRDFADLTRLLKLLERKANKQVTQFVGISVFQRRRAVIMFRSALHTFVYKRTGGRVTFSHTLLRRYKAL